MGPSTPPALEPHPTAAGAPLEAGQARAERALAASETRYRRLFEAAKDGILILDAATGMIDDVNPFLEELTGFSHEEFLGKHLWEIGPFRDIEASKAAFAHLQDQAYVRYEDLPLLARDGRRIAVEFVSNVYPVDGQQVIQCNIRDISARKRAEEERRRLEEQLRTSQKLEAIGSLAGGVAHDFNNLLSVILSYTDFALEGLRSGGAIQEDLQEVKRAGERAVVLTRQLLAFSRKQVLQPVALDLNRVVAEVELMLRRLLGADVEIVLHLAPDLGVVHADPGQMAQVLMNLVVNARDAMPGGGTLTLETTNVEIDAEYASLHVAVVPGPYVQLAVSDTGCGMDRQTRSRVFEPFFTTKAQGKGTGLGLSTAYGIVKQSGGNIWVYSELGQGTTFKVYLPRDLALSAGVVRPPAAAPRRTTGTETILVVEDEPALLEVARRTLEAAGYTVLAAADGAAAEQASRRHPAEIQLLLTDVIMPKQSGSALAKALTRDRPGLRVLFMSGYTDDAILQHGVLEAEAHFLAKPFTAAALALKVREVLDGGGTNQPSPEVGRQAGPAGAPARSAPAPEPPALDREALGAIPRALLDPLLAAVVAARLDEALGLVEALRGDWPAVADGLRTLLEAFDGDALRALLERVGPIHAGR
jgi:PAS domain S-box-containing protein